MSMSNEDFQFIIAQFLLKDEASETPKLHLKKIEERKRAIQNKLENYINELENNEIEIELQDYKFALKQLKNMKASEYEEVVMEIVENYQLLNKKRTKIFPSENTPYPEQVIARKVMPFSEKTLNLSSVITDEFKQPEVENGKSKRLLSEFPWRQGNRKNKK